MEQNEPLELQLEHALIRLSEARALLARVIKYAREDRATTPGSTRLERAVEHASDYLARTRDPMAILRTNTVGQTKIANEPEFCVGDELEYRSERSRLRDSAKRIIERIYTNADQELVVDVRYHHTGNATAYSIDTLTLGFAKHLFRVVATPCTPERPMVDTCNESGRERSAWFGGTT